MPESSHVVHPTRDLVRDWRPDDAQKLTDMYMATASAFPGGGGWQITLSDGKTYWVSSDPLDADTDGDGLNDAEEKANGLSPNAANQLVPSLSMKVTPARGVPGGRAGAYWLADEEVTIEQVPGAVKATILKEAAGAKITEIERETRGGKVVYEAEFVKDGKEIEITVAADGTLLSRQVDDDDDEDDDDDDDEDDDDDN